MTSPSNAIIRTFVLRARAAPTDSVSLLAAVGSDAHTEILAHTLMNAIFVAQSHRDNVVLHL
jgi:tRNA (pseudouridine54-N1)-methyltransferase